MFVLIDQFFFKLHKIWYIVSPTYFSLNVLCIKVSCSLGGLQQICHLNIEWHDQGFALVTRYFLSFAISQLSTVDRSYFLSDTYSDKINEVNFSAEGVCNNSWNNYKTSITTTVPSWNTTLNFFFFNYACLEWWRK